MAVTAAEFQALPQTAYSVARPDLRTGDILLFHSIGLGSLATEYFTNSLWSHAAFIWCIPDVQRVLLLESMDKIGVRVMPMSTRINGNAASPIPFPGKLLVARSDQFPVTPARDKLTAMTQFALDRIGFPYSNQELREIALRLAEGDLGAAPGGRLDPKNQFICSEYVAKCYDAMGIQLAPDREGFIAPGDIANDPSVHALYSLCPDTPER